MKFKRLSAKLVLFIVIVTSHSLFATENKTLADASRPQIESVQKTLTAIEYLQYMQKAYKELNYELIYLNTLQKQVEPKQLIHGVIDNREIAYFRYLNGAIRESLQFAGKTSYFEQGAQAYSLQSNRDHSVFANIANFDLLKGKDSYDYIILGKGRIAGKRAIAVRMVSKDEYRYSYIVWLDMNSYLPLRLDTLNKSNLILDQIMVVSQRITKSVNPWLKKLSQQQLPELLHLPKSVEKQASNWKVSWLPTGFKVIKDDLHKLVMYENEPVSYIMLSDGIVSVSIYISAQRIALNDQQKIIHNGARVLYTYQKANIEINVVGEIPIATAKRLVESVTRIDK